MPTGSTGSSGEAMLQASMTQDRQTIARWLRGQRAAERRATEARARPGSAFEDALELWDLRPELFDEPPDAVREREVAAAREAWKKLRRDWPEHGKA
jgi:hypothetical protein